MRWIGGFDLYVRKVRGVRTLTLLPDKHIPTGRSLVGVGALILDHLSTTSTVSALWDQVKDIPETSSFRTFILALDYLYAVGAIDYQRGYLAKSARSIQIGP